MRPLDAKADGQSGECIALRSEGEDVAVYLTEHARARRLSLRVDAMENRIVLVKPRRVSRIAAVAFATEKIDWIAARLAELPKPIPFAPGTSVPILGQLHVIAHRPDARRGVWIDDGSICVSGPIEHLSRRVHDWLKNEARRVISPIAHGYAAELDVRVTQISVRDTRSRWGSCTAEGKLSFSWRLIFTPQHVLNYVVAHEVAHLREMNHSAKFWGVVEDLIGDRARSTKWLKTQGAELHRYGMKDSNLS